MNITRLFILYNLKMQSIPNLDYSTRKILENSLHLDNMLV